MDKILMFLSNVKHVYSSLWVGKSGLLKTHDFDSTETNALLSSAVLKDLTVYYRHVTASVTESASCI